MSALHDTGERGGGAERALEAHYFTDPGLFETERRKIFYRTWQFAGHVSQLERPGGYFTFDVCGQNLFAVRTAGGEVRAFHNVCMHRAHELLTGSGRARLIVCPYHAWTYELDGRLRRAPNQSRVDGFDGSQICLSQVRTEILCGFVFVNLDAGAAPMGEWYPGVEAELGAFVPDIDRLRTIRVNEVEEACNWKVAVENYNECYHCVLCHPTFSSGVVDPKSYNIAARDHCLRHTTAAADPERLTYAIDPDANPNATRYASWFLWPAFSFQVYPGNVLNTYWWRPRSVDATTMYRGWHTRDGVLSETVLKLAQQDLETTVAEDLVLVESVQRGLNSLGYRPGPLVIDRDQGVNSEHSIRALKHWTLEALAE